MNESTRLAEHIASIDDRIHTVAFVNREALSDAALIALACDELVMHPDATTRRPRRGQKPARRRSGRAALGLQEMFGRLGRDWSLPLALIDPDIEVHRYSNPLTGEVRYLSAEEEKTVDNIEEWQDNGPVAPRPTVWMLRRPK